MRPLIKAGIFVLFAGSFSACIIQGPGGGFYMGKDSCGFASNQMTGKGMRWDKSKFPVVFHPDFRIL